MKLQINIDDNKLLNVIKESHSRSEVLRKIGIDKANGTSIRLINNEIKRLGADIKHFDPTGRKLQRKYERKIVNCPVCNESFEIKEGSTTNKITCSAKCRNIHKGLNNDYRKICFLNHEFKCVVCEEDKILDVHHMDENKRNNSPKNLIPLCPTHHRYWHSKFKKLVEDKIYEYINNKFLEVD